MIIKCLNNEGRYLTIGRLYSVIDRTKGGGYFLLRNDRGDELWYNKVLFIDIKELRRKKLKKICISE